MNNNILNHINYNINPLSHNNNVQILADQARNVTSQILTGEYLIRRNVEPEARRYNNHIIATDNIWNSRLTTSEKNYSNRANNINNTDTIDRITRITTRQITNNPLEDDFFNGSNCHEWNNLDSSNLLEPSSLFLDRTDTFL
ncbi:hypothetical protein C1645_834030 [Glomus cerebriforme]|uniref:Uncharacterized protein n=1 Tax=Glomus cerebriforme TaxID=658196 RepID=A0A397SAG9_9GLOM|nr:hypothetical protein C1645_834030 [Glomus cerebriforme]